MYAETLPSRTCSRGSLLLATPPVCLGLRESERERARERARERKRERESERATGWEGRGEGDDRRVSNTTERERDRARARARERETQKMSSKDSTPNDHTTPAYRYSHSPSRPLAPPSLPLHTSPSHRIGTRRDTGDLFWLRRPIECCSRQKCHPCERGPADG